MAFPASLSAAATGFCQGLGLDVPVIQAPMAGEVAKPGLVLAVARAGGLGSLGAGYLAPEAMRDMIREIRSGTDRPFNVNLFAPRPDGGPVPRQANPAQFAARLAPFHTALGLPAPAIPEPPQGDDFAERVRILIAEKVPVFSFTFGIPPRELLQECRDAGICCIGTATTIAEGVALQEAGVDMVVAQGIEAGGHRGSFLPPFADEQAPAAAIGTLALVPRMVDALQIPVIAAGGIGDGRGVLASLVLGAAAVQVGTAFLSTEESALASAAKTAILETEGEETALTCAFSGKPARGVRNRFLDAMAACQDEVPPYPLANAMTGPMRKAASAAGETGCMSLWAGQAARLGRREPVASLMQELTRLLP